MTRQMLSMVRGMRMSASMVGGLVAVEFVGRCATFSRPQFGPRIGENGGHRT